MKRKIGTAGRRIAPAGAPLLVLGPRPALRSGSACHRIRRCCPYMELPWQRSLV